MGNQYSHLNIANVGEIIACDFKQISNLYLEIMKTRGVLDSSIESKASKGDQELDLDIPYSLPQNTIARTDFMIELNDLKDTFKGFYPAGNTIFF